MPYIKDYAQLIILKVPKSGDFTIYSYQKVGGSMNNRVELSKAINNKIFFKINFKSYLQINNKIFLKNVLARMAVLC